MIKKVVISPKNNSKAIAFFEELSKKKDEALCKSNERTAQIRKKLKEKALAH